MDGQESRGRGPIIAVSVVALAVTVAALAAGRREENGDVPPEAAGWYGAMSLYRTLAMWAGKRAMQAELHYWRAVS